MIAAVRDGNSDDGGRLRPHREPRVAVRQRHFDVRDDASPQRLTTPRYRAPGAIARRHLLDDAITREVAQKNRKTRDETWIATKRSTTRIPVNRTDAIGFMGGAQNTNEECYLCRRRPACSAWLTSSIRGIRCPPWSGLHHARGATAASRTATVVLFGTPLGRPGPAWPAVKVPLFVRTVIQPFLNDGPPAAARCTVPLPSPRRRGDDAGEFAAHIEG